MVLNASTPVDSIFIPATPRHLQDSLISNLPAYQVALSPENDFK